MNLNTHGTKTFSPCIGYVASFMQQSSIGPHRWNLVLFFWYNQRWFYFKETATSLTEQPMWNIHMHVCPYITVTYATVISTKTDLTSTLVSSSQMLFGEFWTFRSPSKLQTLIAEWSFLYRVYWEIQARANLQQKWKTAKESVVFYS